MVRSSKFGLGVILFVLVAAVTSVRAETGPEFIWDSYQGFLPAADCRPEPLESADIWVSKEQFRVLDKNGKPWLDLVSGSLIKLKEDAKPKKLGGVTYKPIRLVGVPREAELKGDYALKGISMAYLPETLFSPLQNFEILITSELEMEKIPTITKLGTTAVDLKGTIWRAAIENNKYVKLVCGDKSFIAFYVYAPGENYPSARVGVNKDGTRIFNHIDTRRIKADEVVVVDVPAPVATPPPRQEPAPTPPPAQTQIVDVQMPRPRPKAADDALAAKQNELALCSANPTAVIRKDLPNLDPDETFEVQWGEKIEEIPASEFTPWFIDLRGVKHEYSKVRFPLRKNESERIGWVAKVYIKTRKDCPNHPAAEEVAQGATAAIVGGNYLGSRCNRGDTDRLKCMICAIHWEANLESFQGMVEVGRTIMKRVASPKWPKTVCKVAYQSGQYVGLKSGKVITRDKKTYDRLHRAAQEAIRLGPGRFIGFRTCSYSRKGTNIGGNCFRTTAALDTSFGLDLIQSARVEKPLDNYVEWMTEEELERIEQTPPYLRQP